MAINNAIADVFADAALAYEARITGGDIVVGTRLTHTKSEFLALYEKREKDILKMLKTQPLHAICQKEKIGHEGEKILAKEISRLLSRDLDR